MASKIDICNRALLKIGQPSIMSLDDNSQLARLCLQEFDAALEATLRSYPWPFAIKRAELARQQDKPPFGPSFYYSLPSDSVRLVDVLTGGLPYQIEGTAVATNAGSVAVRYVSKSIPISAMDAQTKDVIALMLATRLAITVTENPQLKDMLYAETQQVLAQARNTAAVEDYPQEPIEGAWLPSRVAGQGTSYFTSQFNPWGPDGSGVTSND